MSRNEVVEIILTTPDYLNAQALGDTVAAKDASEAAQEAAEEARDLAQEAKDAAEAAQSGFVDEGYIPRDELVGTVSRLNRTLCYLPLLHSFTEGEFAGRLQFTRTGEAHYYDRYGLLKTAAADQPRFERDGLLMEGPSTNLFPYSEDFSQWTMDGATVSSVGDASPDGGTDGTRLIPDNGEADGGISHTPTVSDGATITVSLMVKKMDYGQIKISVAKDGADDLVSAYFGILTGTGWSVSGAGTANIFDPGGGYYRCILTLKVDAGVTQPEIRISTPVAGDGVKSTCIYGAQVEEHSFVTSYIHTDGAVATRGGEMCRLSFYDNVPSAVHDHSMSFQFDAHGIADDEGPMVFDVGETGGKARSLRFTGSAANLELAHGTPVLVGSTGVALEDARHLVVTFVNKSTTVHVNEEVVATGQSDIEVSIPDWIYIGCNKAADAWLWGHLRDVRFYDFALSHTEARLI